MDISPGNGKYVAFDDQVLNYNVTKAMNSNVSAQNDVVIGLWTRYLNYLPKTMVWSGRHVLFKLYTNSAGEREAGVASFAAYFTSNSYIFETYTRDSNNKSVTIISKSVSVSSDKLENSWNFVSLGLNQNAKTMSVYVKFENNETVSLNLSTSLNQDAGSDVLAAYFCQEPSGNSLGFNGQISSSVVLYGKNIAKNFLKIWDGYYPYPETSDQNDNYTVLLNPSITEIDYESSFPQLFSTEFSESRAYSTSGWFKYSQIYPKYTNNTQEHTLLQFDLNTNDPFTKSSLSASLFPYNQTIKFQYSPVFSDPVLLYLSSPKNFSYINIENNWIFL
ncbi:MAG: hypothetical protein KDA89_25160, partial [Planctomycetaceae bacterium]|nr:hypothetical protein [Planctomycetaceae bacterium]